MPTCIKETYTKKKDTKKKILPGPVCQIQGFPVVLLTKPDSAFLYIYSPNIEPLAILASPAREKCQCPCYNWQLIRYYGPNMAANRILCNIDSSNNFHHCPAQMTTTRPKWLFGCLFHQMTGKRAFGGSPYIESSERGCCSPYFHQSNRMTNPRRGDTQTFLG